jgi:hypothetical protein
MICHKHVKMNYFYEYVEFKSLDSSIKITADFSSVFYLSKVKRLKFDKQNKGNRLQILTLINL